jgi:uncharacterized zinc-type alcohol dehydrogenase-like protein
MIPTKAYAVHNATSPLTPWNFERRDPGPDDVQIEILYCGVCHSDIHQARSEWGPSIYPMVPGHEIVGRITAVGKNVKNFKVGGLAGIGCFVDSCRKCQYCLEGEEQYCVEGSTSTYNSYERDKKTISHGGYSTTIVVDEQYTLHVSDKFPLHAVAPLLCAGITTYSPLRHWKVGKGHKIAVLGLGGLGHMAVKFGNSFGAEVTVLSTSPSKEADARRLGAHHFSLTTDPEVLNSLKGSFDFIIDTVSAEHDYQLYLRMLKVNGIMICVGAPPTPSQISGMALIVGRKSIAGSLIGGIRETQEMLDYCAEHNIVSDVEVIQIDAINEAYERVINHDVKYRFVIDIASLRK